MTLHSFATACGVLAGTSLIMRLVRRKSQAVEDGAMRENLSTKQVDKMVDSSFPASDPPSTY